MATGMFRCISCGMPLSAVTRGHVCAPRESSSKLLAAIASQPPPAANEHPAAWDLVLEDLGDGHALLVEDIRARDAEGRRKYGVPLQPHNGRDMLIDAYQEALDLVVYLRAAEEEGLPIAKASTYQRALGIAIDLREMLFERDGR